MLLLVAHQLFAAPTYYSPITINHTQVPSTQTDFPVLINITDSRFKDVAHSGHVQSTNGYDIRPWSSASIFATPIIYELERYNPSTGEIVIWAKIPSLSSSSDTVIYIAYGDSSLTTDGSSSATWSNGFLGVYHLKDGTTLNVLDSTGANNGTNHSVTAAIGQIDGAGGFASVSSQYIDCGTGMNPTAITLSAWVNGTTFPSSYISVLSRDVNGSYDSLLVKSNGKLACYLVASADVHYDGTGSHTLSTGQWYYLVMTYNSTSGLIGYVNAASDGTGAANGSLNTSTARTDIGQDPNNTGRFWNGVIDEARVSSVARSADWITTEYNNQNTPGTFETLNSEVGPLPTPTPTATSTPTATASATFTPTATATASFTPCAPTPTNTPTATPSDTPTPTATATASFTPCALCSGISRARADNPQ